jgi:hypothetical protein
MVVAARNGHFNAVLYLFRKGSARVTDDIPNCAAKGGHLEIIRWFLRCHRDDMSGWEMFNLACMHEHFYCAQWLMDRGLEYDLAGRPLWLSSGRAKHSVFV